MKITILTISTLLLLSGCVQKNTQPLRKQVVVKQQKIDHTLKHNTPTPPPPPPPKKEIKLKKVEDTNYSDSYMYPKTPEKKAKVVHTDDSTHLATKSTMGKQECIAMISQEKFDKYTAMFGSEDASIKRCNMIRSMNQ